MVLPVSVSAAAGTVISLVPLKFTPLICLGVANCVAELALPVSVAPTNVLACTTLNVLVPELAVTLPVTLPTKFAEIVPAENPPSEFLATNLPTTFEGVASTLHVVSKLPSKSEPKMYVPLTNLFVVEDLIVTFC